MYSPKPLTPEQSAIREKNDVILDKLIDSLRLKNDAALSRALDVAPPVVSKMRYGKLPFGAIYQIRAHELTGLPIREIKALIGEKCLDQMIVS